jgi:transcriptional regulator with XRE-family HTH domain
VNRLGYALKRLCDLRGITQIQLGERIGISAPAVSNIINGNSKPRPITLTKLIHVLCHTRDEYQNLIACYEGGADKLKEIPEFLEWKPSEEEETERARRYLKVKADSIRFENAVADTLELGGFEFQRSVIKDDIVADFIVETPSSTIAIECKYNVHRDFEKTAAIAKLLKESLKIDSVLIVVPHSSDIVTKEASGLTIVEFLNQDEQ